MKKYFNPNADRWFEGIIEDLSSFPFSFVYGGELIKGFSPYNFTLIDKTTERIGDKESTTFAFLFKDGITVTLKTVHYYDFGASEWTVWFENTADKNSGVIENLKTELSFEGTDAVVNKLVPPKKAALVELNQKALQMGKDFAL